MFLLRCAFWLSIVYASMSWGSDAFHRRGPLDTAMAMPSVGVIAERVKAAGSTVCRGREMQCLTDAAAMTGLVKTALSRGDNDVTVQDADDVPLPPRAPRHHIVTGMLTPHA